MYPDSIFAMSRLSRLDRELSQHPAEHHRRVAEGLRRQRTRRRWTSFSRRITPRW